YNIFDPFLNSIQRPRIIQRVITRLVVYGGTLVGRLLRITQQAVVSNSDSFIESFYDLDEKFPIFLCVSIGYDLRGFWGVIPLDCDDLFGHMIDWVTLFLWKNRRFFRLL
ncbi:hypothetical protein HAX54_020591, partial [Datura stramonium]|nr:hypothetical protein [Datura stramonium]